VIIFAVRASLRATHCKLFLISKSGFAVRNRLRLTAKPAYPVVLVQLVHRSRYIQQRRKAPKFHDRIYRSLISQNIFSLSGTRGNIWMSKILVLPYYRIERCWDTQFRLAWHQYEASKICQCRRCSLSSAVVTVRDVYVCPPREVRMGLQLLQYPTTPGCAGTLRPEPQDRLSYVSLIRLKFLVSKTCC
jgi:hypothetical protein